MRGRDGTISPDYCLKGRWETQVIRSWMRNNYHLYYFLLFLLSLLFFLFFNIIIVKIILSSFLLLSYIQVFGECAMIFGILMADFYYFNPCV